MNERLVAKLEHNYEKYFDIRNKNVGNSVKSCQKSRLSTTEKRPVGYYLSDYVEKIFVKKM